MSNSAPINASPRTSSVNASAPGFSASDSLASEVGAQGKSPARNRTWMGSLTLVCFIFGGLMAMQLRAVERVRNDREKQAEKQQYDQKQNAVMAKTIAAEAERRRTLEAQLATLNSSLKSEKSVSKATLTKLSAQLKELQMLSGFTPISGPGVRMTLADNPEAAKLGGNSPFLPGIVHDFDLLQIVNELRNAKADGIAVNGRRITAYTPIRCVGGPILINYEPVTPPYRIEAIGDQDTIEENLTYAGGIVDNLRNPSAGPGLQIKITRQDRIDLPASENVPRMQVAQAPDKP
ncbi:MAG: hypothetical protein JWN98_780 [Abditibacteriota bacterium]|nr:hypothetical protein [Abditibacteriota bacterium]